MGVKIFFITMISLFLLGVTGCSVEESSQEPHAEGISQEKDNQTDDVIEEAEEKTEINVDWSLVIDETKKEVTNPEYFSFVKDVFIDVNEDKKQITFTAALDDSTSDEVALDFADTLLRRFNSVAQMYDNSIKSGSKDYLGGVYDEYSLSIGVAPLSKTNETKSWYIHDAISKGVQRAPKLQK